MWSKNGGSSHEEVCEEAHQDTLEVVFPNNQSYLALKKWQKNHCKCTSDFQLEKQTQSLTNVQNSGCFEMHE